MMMTALVRNANGDLKVKYDDWFTNQKDFAEELRANGFKVLKTWRGEKTHAEVEDWEFFNRK